MKSHVSDSLELAELIYYDALARCVAVSPDLRDLKTIRSRVEDEGLSFLTITLPEFCNDFERSLALGHIDPKFFRSFRKNRAIPAFLQGMLSRIFNQETGRILDARSGVVPDPVPTIVEGIRQICLSFKKVELDCTPKRVHRSIQGYICTERDLDSFSIDHEELRVFSTISSVLWASVVSNITVSDLMPRHGPGATAERISGNQKYAWQLWHDRLDVYFPLIDSGYPIGLNPLREEEVENVSIIPEEQETPVRVVTVPKTMKGPRIIAIEPCCMQYAQQAIRGPLYEHLERSRIVGGHVNFTDQSINRQLALVASKTGLLATVDLSEASDRVPHDVALKMFDGNPILRNAIDSCRTTHAELPDGSKIGPLKKFASMGSALCFPIESMYFYTVCVRALLAIQNLPVNKHNIHVCAKLVYVYGDDIIIPSKQATKVLDYLQKYNCKVNTNKTFWSGKFRESCGMDAYDGVEVTPTYIRQMRPENLQQASRIVSWVKTANLFESRGFVRTAEYLYQGVERLLGSLPNVPENFAGLGRMPLPAASFPRKGFSKGPNGPRKAKYRWNDRYQRLEVRCWVADPVYRADRLEGWAALQKSLMKLTGLLDLTESRDPLHLERSARHGAVTLKRRWVSTT